MGGVYLGSNITYAQARIYLPDYPATYSPSTSIGTVLVGDSVDGHAQVGWRKLDDSVVSNNTGMRKYAEVHDPGSSSVYLYLSTNSGVPSANTYDSYYVMASNGNWQAQIGSTVVLTYPKTFTANQADYMEEITSTSGQADKAQYGGKNSNRAWMDSIGVTDNGTYTSRPSLSFSGQIDSVLVNTSSYPTTGTWQMYDSRY
jgi:hypothetical protein